MKAAFLMGAVAAVGAILWASGVFAPPARHFLISDTTASLLPNGTAAATLVIENKGAPDTLVGVSSTLGHAEFRNAERGLPIPVGTSSLALDAAHITISATETAFEEGVLIPLTLRFQNAGEISFKARFAAPDPNSMAAHMAMGHGTMAHEVTHAPKPTLALNVAPNGQGWIAQIDAKNFTYSEELQDGDHVPGTGHGHVYIGDMKLGRFFSDSYNIGALPKGQHALRVTLNTNDHRAYVVDGEPLAAETTIVVD